MQPSLLDRLIDCNEDPAEMRRFSLRRLRDAVMRDLGWLLSASRMETTTELGAFPHVRDSTLNYGVRTLVGATRDGADPGALRQDIITSIRRFEPRLIPSSITVAQLDQEDGGDMVRLRIEADLWAQPVPHRLILQTETDLTHGTVRVSAGRAEPA